MNYKWEKNTKRSTKYRTSTTILEKYQPETKEDVQEKR